MKSTHMLFFFFFSFSSSCLAISSSLSRLTDATPNCPKWKSIPQHFSLLLSFKCIPCRQWSCFSFSKLFLPFQQRFGIWSLDGNVSIRVHTTLLAQIEVLSQVVFFQVHRSGRLMMGTHWSIQRLSLQNRFTLLKAGSFHNVEVGLWKYK